VKNKDFSGDEFSPLFEKYTFKKKILSQIPCFGGVGGGEECKKIITIAYKM